MEKQAIYFVESKGVKLYKCDSFWTKSTRVDDAKIHDDSEYDKKRFFDSLTSDVKPWKSDTLSDEEFKRLKDRYNESLYGYQTIEGPTNGITIAEDCKLSDPVYLRQIISIDQKGEFDSIDYKVKMRDDKINQIIK